ncbi:hypothetical protein RND71_007565 [Anisodus tanguticus]|uniref:Uncharacterized protein n=1 Tax=Anisodus tanguticus TaxID=243964 RepID=A0AAE1SM70_9SOLA|nr:hypothetical protein RND71_007565 [Anisodus tanguticus]
MAPWWAPPFQYFNVFIFYFKKFIQHITPPLPINLRRYATHDHGNDGKLRLLFRENDTSLFFEVEGDQKLQLHFHFASITKQGLNEEQRNCKATIFLLLFFNNRIRKRTLEKN